jgi:hypothetical protein
MEVSDQPRAPRCFPPEETAPETQCGIPSQSVRYTEKISYPCWEMNPDTSIVIEIIEQRCLRKISFGIPSPWKKGKDIPVTSPGGT